MLFMALLLAVVGGLGLAGTMSLNVLERTREIGVMRSIGASNGSVRSVVMVEGMLIGLISWAIGAVLSIPASLGFSTAVGMAFMGRPLVFSFSIQGVIAWLVLALAVAAVASLLPAQRAAQISVRESLAYE
jgi:putative ABC transport system permease protein